MSQMEWSTLTDSRWGYYNGKVKIQFCFGGKTKYSRVEPIAVYVTT